MIQQMGGDRYEFDMINEFCTPLCSECAGPQGRKIYQNQHGGVLPESFEVHAENHCKFLYKTSISSNRDEIIWPYNVSIQGRWSSQSRCDSDCMGWVQKRFFVKGLVTMVTRVPGIQRCNPQKDKPRISTKRRITLSTKCYTNDA